ncbi:MAG TPA: ABC transporter substrate-binding protein [Casimicrobiaceae bacterium]|jgi:ABC-type transport system substrate-binding protein
MNVARTLLIFSALLCGSPAHTADMTKTLRVAFAAAENGFDPQAIYDVYSEAVCSAIFDPLYTHDYFARPVQMIPNTADGLPQITDGGRTFTIKVKRGIYFAADPVFKGKQRELTADDYVYSIKRIFDPKVRSYDLYLFENSLVGLDAPLARARKSGTFDYDEKIEGLQALDRYTLRIRFRRPEYAFQWWLATRNLAAVAREVVEAYGDSSHRVMEHPVGTGPYRLKSWLRGQKIVLEANPDFRDMRYPEPATSDSADTTAAKGLVGRPLPIVGNIEISIIEEGQPRLLTFESGKLDYLSLANPASLAANVLDGDRLKPAFANKGVVLHRGVAPALFFFFFNVENPVVGGYTPAKVALRRAVSLGYDRDTGIRILLNGQGIPASQPVPPPLFGHDAALSAKSSYDPAAARALLDKFGYKDRDGDGYRENPDGTTLTLVKASITDASARVSDELWKKNMDAIGLRITFLKNKWPELNKMSEAGQLMMWGVGWTASTPDGDPFYSYLYGKNIGTSNDARLRLPEYDKLYEQAHALPNGDERNQLFRKMTELIVGYAPWIMSNYPYYNIVAQPWLKGFKINPFKTHQWQYYDIDSAARR